MRLEYAKQTLGAGHAIGGAAFSEHGTTSAELLTFADQCLYESKSHGRDVTVSMQGRHFQRLH
jgi:predicted signal transduction protein with EAL and GGDEF domain